VPAASIPEIKQAVRSVSIADCQAVAKRVLEMNSARDVKAFLRDQKRRLLAETIA
jgi:phosphotransferase system enzyme I (PtsI)